MMIKVLNYQKRYRGKPILRDVSFELLDHGVVALVGASGSGKTTLLNALGGIDVSYEGTVLIGGRDYRKHDEAENRAYRLRHVGYVFQNFNLFPLDSVLDNVLLPNECCSNLSYDLKKKRAVDLIAAFGLKDRLKTPVNRLSGGEKQRVAIMRAIINDPHLILADEPTGALDEKNGAEIYRLLRQLSHKALVIIATHDEKGVMKIADRIIRLKDKTAVMTYNDASDADRGKDMLVLGTGSFSRHSALPFSFQIRHAFQKMKVKKFRSGLVNLALAFALTSVGATMILKTAAEKKLSAIFSEIADDREIVMEPRHRSANVFAGVYAAKKERIMPLYERYAYYFDGLGVTYLVNFEDFFQSRNEAYVSANGIRPPLHGLSARSINDFRWLTPSFAGAVFPEDPPAELADDEVLLGLTYPDMANLCKAFGIERSYQVLGDRLKEETVFLTFLFGNDDWQYEDEQIFRFSYVTEAPSTTIYHTNHLWNETVFETMMRLPPGDGSPKLFPWEMEKICYFKTIEDPKVFLDIAMFDPDLQDYVFERTSFAFHPLLCPAGEACQEHRVLVFYTDKNALDCSHLKRIREIEPRLASYYLTSEYGYVAAGGALMSGFAKSVFLSYQDALVDQAIDAATAVHGDERFTISLPEGVVEGNYLLSLAGGVRFSSSYDGLSKGRRPVSDDEIVVSRGLAEKLGSFSPLGQRVWFGAEVSEERDNEGRLDREFRKTPLTIVGVTEEKKPFIHQGALWTISIFRDRLGISSFQLTPTGAVFEVDKSFRDDVPGMIRRLNSSFHDYTFANPVETLTESMRATLSYLEQVLLAFSLAAIIIAMILHGVIVYLNITESKGEIELFRYLGVSEGDAASTFLVQALLHGFIGFLIAAFEIIIIDYFLSLAFSGLFLTGLVWRFDPAVLLWTLLTALSLTLPVALCVSLSLRKKKKEPIIRPKKRPLKKHF